MALEKNLNSRLKIRGYNYIESADYRLYDNNNISNGYTGAIRAVARYSTNTSLLSHTETGGTGG